MKVSLICGEVRKHLINKFNDKMSARDLMDLLDMAEKFTLTMISFCDVSCPDNTIIIRINPEKFDTEMLMCVEDDWINYITNEKGLDPSDAMMITPF